MANTRTLYQPPGEAGMMTYSTRATAAATAGSTSTFLVPIPSRGQLLASLICRSNTSGTKTGEALVAVTWTRPALTEAYHAAATVLHTALTTEVTAITVGTPTVTGMLPVTVTFLAGTNGVVDARWRGLLQAFDFNTNRVSGALENVPGQDIPGTLTDSFSRADSATTLGSLETGGVVWAVGSGTWGVTGGLGYSVTGADGDVVTFDTTSTLHRIEATLSTITAAGLVARYVDTNNYYRLEAFGGGWRMFKRVAGTNTAITLPGATIANGDRIGLDCTAGTSIKISKNGQVAATITDAALTAGTKCGLRSAGTGGRWDDVIAAVATY